MRRINTSLLLLAVSLGAAAQEERSVSLNPVIVTGTGTYHKAENSPVSVKVISQKELKDTKSTSLQEALTRLTTNITTHTSGMGTMVSFNGVSDDYILILINGKKVNGDDRWNRVSIDNVKRIEILSGAASALYGSEAIAGVINIITDDAASGLEVSSNTKLKSKNRFNQDVNIDVTSGAFSSFTSYSHHQADNWQINKYQAFQEDDQEVYKLTGRPMSVGFRSDNISERLEWRFADGWSAYLKGDYYDYTTLRDHNASYFTQKVTTDKDTGDKSYSYTSKPAYTYDLHHNSYNIGAGARWVPNRNTHIYLDVYTDNYKSAYDYWQTAENEAYDETRKRTHCYNETLKGIFRLNDWNKLSAGTEFIQESLNSSSDNIDSEHSYTYNVFAQNEMSIAQGLEAVIGLRYTYNNGFGSHLTPNLAVFWHHGGLRLRASYAGGYRTPTLSQLYATDQAKTNSRYTINNTNLRPEQNHFWNANAEYSGSWYSVSITGFINNIRDMINYRTMTQNEIDSDGHLTELYNQGWTTIRQRDNIDRATIYGLSANIRLLLPYGFTLGGGYAYNDSKATTTTLNQKTQEYEETVTPVDKSIRNVASIMASWDYSHNGYSINISLNGHIQGQRYSSTYGYAPKYQQWDLSTRHTIALHQVVLEPGLGIENLFNKRDTSYWNSNFSTVNPGRSVFVSLAVKFTEK